MLKRTLIVALAATAIGAGAFAVQASDTKSIAGSPANVTVLKKNQVLPIRGSVSHDPCVQHHCQEI